MANTYWTEERLQEVRDMAQKMPIRDVARHYKVTKDAMSAVYTRNSIRIPKELHDKSNDTRNRLSREEVIGIREHTYERGLVTRLGKKYNLSVSFISQIRSNKVLCDIV